MKEQNYRRPVAVDSFICDRPFSFSGNSEVNRYAEENDH